MSKPAYDEGYLDDMYLKNRYLFKLIARNCREPFSAIRQYMESDCRKGMDVGNPKYLNKTPKQILGDMGIRISAKAGISEQYDEFILEWMADIYTYIQWYYNIPSAVIGVKIAPEQLYQKYFPMHEAAVSRGAEKLVKQYGLNTETLSGVE